MAAPPKLLSRLAGIVSTILEDSSSPDVFMNCNRVPTSPFWASDHSLTFQPPPLPRFPSFPRGVGSLLVGKRKSVHESALCARRFSGGRPPKSGFFFVLFFFFWFSPEIRHAPPPFGNPFSSYARLGWSLSTWDCSAFFFFPKPPPSLTSSRSF